MPRIRTIKPEFPQSESMGRVSRDARLLFIQLWTVCDDYGRTRAAPKLLAGLLYPFDDDTTPLIQGWLDELERESCLKQYLIEGTHYLEISAWAEHQRIDNAGKSSIPKPPAETLGEPPRTAETLGGSRLDLGPRNRKGPRKERKKEKTPPKGPPLTAVPENAPPCPPRGENVDVTGMIKIWNDTATRIGLPLVTQVHGNRQKKAATRFRQCGGLAGWELACKKLETAGHAWMHGDNDRGWRADFDFLLQQKSFSRLMEGSYDRSAKANGHAHGHATDLSKTTTSEPWEQRMAAFRKTGAWRNEWGFRPGERGCRVPPALLELFSSANKGESE